MAAPPLANSVVHMDERDYRSTRVYQLSRLFLTRPEAPALDRGPEVPRGDGRKHAVNGPTFNQHLSAP
jgi:hypothetical protein